MPEFVSPAEVERFYRAALVGLRILDGARGRKHRFGSGAHCRWGGFQGNLGTSSLLAVVIRVMLSAVVLWSFQAQAEAVTPQDVEAVRARLREERQVLDARAGRLSWEEREAVGLKLARAEGALQSYLEIAKQGDERAFVEIPLYVAGGAIITDDVSGVGVGDDVLLPAVALGLLFAHLSTKTPASSAAIRVAWAQTLACLQDVVRSVEEINARYHAAVIAVAMAAAAKPCSCVCYKRGEGPLSVKQRPNLAACRRACIEERDFTGYQCGGAVLWK